MTNIDNYKEIIFESLKQTNEFGSDFWFARDLANALDYSQWRNFLNVVDKAKEACEHSHNHVPDHFADVSKMVQLGSGSLTRPAGGRSRRCRRRC